MNKDNEAAYKHLDNLKKASSKYNKTDKAKQGVRKWQLKTKYGLSLDDYNTLLKKQNHKCDICGIDEVDTKKGLCVDHCHIAGQVRSLLCTTCNSGLGMFKESEELLTKAILYLRKYKIKK